MVSPPAKRQKRLPFPSPNPSNDLNQQEPLESRSNVRTKSSSAKSTLLRSASTSPAKTCRSGKSKTLYSFFNAATETQRVGAIKTQEEQQKQKASKDSKELRDQDDKIEDYDLDEKASSSFRVADRPRNGPINTSSSKRFVFQSKSEEASPVDSRPWAEMYGPASIDELAIHKKKVANVRSWLEHVFHGHAHQVWLFCSLISANPTATPHTQRSLWERQKYND